MSFPPIDETHDPALQCWVTGAQDHAPFPVQNLPFGVFSQGETGKARIGVAIGDFVLDLGAIAELLPVPRTMLEVGGLEALMARPQAARLALRRALSRVLSDPAMEARVGPHLHAQADCMMHLPMRIGDYTDFYVGIHHARNIGALLRPDEPLLPNYKHVPIGYHGRASSVRPSGVTVRRPFGQSLPAGHETPQFGPSARLDYEVELGVWIGQGSALGEPVPIARAGEHIAGFCLLNDWSARDIQAWEYRPLGPFLAKNFHTTISPWVVTAEAMAPFRQPQLERPEGDPPVPDYLWDGLDQASGALALDLEAFIQSAAMRSAGIAPVRLSCGQAANMYWTVQQMVAHHTSNGCNLATGDLLGTGTISSESRAGWGSLMELTKAGREPITLPSGETRKFLEDGDEVTLRATARAEGRVPIGFGECRAVVEGVATSCAD